MTIHDLTPQEIAVIRHCLEWNEGCHCPPPSEEDWIEFGILYKRLQDPDLITTA